MRPLLPHPQDLAHADAIASRAEDLGCDLAVIPPFASEAEDLIDVVSRRLVRAAPTLALELGRWPNDEREDGEAIDARIACNEFAARASPSEECVVGDEVLRQRLGGHFMSYFA